MSLVVEMFRDSVEPGGRDRFECSRVEWDLLLEIGKAFGWKPRGTRYAPNAGDDLSETIVFRDYRPGDSRDRKHVDAEDANAWASALAEARISPHLPAMIDAQLQLVSNRDPEADEEHRVDLATSALIGEFVEYAFGGGFNFALAS